MRFCCWLGASILMLAVSGRVLAQYGDISDFKVAKPEDKVDAASVPATPNTPGRKTRDRQPRSGVPSERGTMIRKTSKSPFFALHMRTSLFSQQAIRRPSVPIRRHTVAELYS